MDRIARAPISLKYNVFLILDEASLSALGQFSSGTRSFRYRADRPSVRIYLILRSQSRWLPICSQDLSKMRPSPDPDKQQTSGQIPKRWLIVVARGQADLYTHLAQAFSRDSKVRVILDRRKDDTRNSPQITHRLRTHGAVIFRQPE